VESGLFCLYGARLEKINAARMSAAGEGLTEPILYLRLLAQMQTSLATRTKSPESAYAESGLFCLYGARLERSNATVRWTVACRRLDGGNTSIFFPLGRKCKRVSPLGPKPPVFSTKTGGFAYLLCQSSILHLINHR